MINWRWLRARAPGAVLATLFLIESTRLAVAAWIDSWIGIDAHIYYRGSLAWIAGQSPWDSLSYFIDQPAHYSALPTTVLLLAPFALLPELAFVVGLILASALAAVYVVRTLGLPWYYLAFPPLFQGVQSGNPNVVLLALLLSGRPVLEALAPMLKVYAGIPLVLLGRWRSTGWALVFGALTLVAMPLWIEYLTTYADRTARLMIEAGGGYSAWKLGPVAVVIVAATLILLWRRDRKAGSWLAVPALWPASQLHYSIFALPVIGDRWWLAALLAVQLPSLPSAVPTVLLIEAAARHAWGLRRPPVGRSPRPVRGGG